MLVSADIARYGLYHTKFRCSVFICSEIGEMDVEKIFINAPLFQQVKVQTPADMAVSKCLN